MNIHMKKKTLDLFIILLGIFCAVLSYYQMQDTAFRQWCITICIGITGISILDMLFQLRDKSQDEWNEIPERMPGQTHIQENGISQVILLDEEERPIRSWDLAGKTSLIIGRENKYEDIDIDLGECEYNALIDFQHAVLNYCVEQWYIEDLYSKNGIRIRKAEDSICYKISKDKPCRVNPGDVILIANTKLLIS